MLEPWSLKQGPRYAESLGIARDAAGDLFDRNLIELRNRIRINPSEATPFLDENHRVLQLVDIPNDYSLAIYVTLDPQKHVCRIEWIEVGPVEPDVDPWE